MLAPTLATPAAGLADQRVQLRVADEVEAGLRGDGGGVLAGRIAPDLLAVPGVEAERPTVQRREVDDPVDHGRRSGDPAVGVEAPADVAGRGIERVEGAVVRADHDVSSPDGCGAVDEVAGAVRPAELPARGAVGIHLPVRRAQVDTPVGDRWIGVEGAGSADPRLRGGSPHLLARARVES